MPRFDRTGPNGMGPMTGGGRGLRNTVAAPRTGYSAYGAPRLYGRFPLFRGLGRALWGIGRGLFVRRGWGGRGRGRGRW